MGAWLVGFAVKRVQIIVLLTAAALFAGNSYAVRLKDIVRIQHEEPLTMIGYGLVVGLSGTGDSSRNEMTVQSLINTLSNFGLVLDEQSVLSRNVAAVMVTSKISSFAERGDQFDISVSSIGDARSLSGGTLVLTPLYGVDKKIYAFAQGQLTVGGYSIDQLENSIRKNHFTVGRVVKGATLERQIDNSLSDGGELNIVLNNPDYTTATRISDAIIRNFKGSRVKAEHSGKLTLTLPENMDKIRFISILENLEVTPETIARVVINEKTGTIVAGGKVVISEVSIAHGDLEIEISTRYAVSQPENGFFREGGIRTAITPEVDLKVNEQLGKPVSLPEGTSVATLVQTLNEVGLTTRDIITILQSIKTAGALHADLIIE